MSSYLYLLQIQHEIKCAIAGTKDLDEILEETMELIENNLPKEGKLLSKMIEIQRENDSTEIIEENHHHDYDDNDSSDGGQDPDGLFDFDNEAMMLSLDQAQMECEDWRSFSSKYLSIYLIIYIYI
jgi:hypothetical protein